MADEIPEQVFTDAARAYVVTECAPYENTSPDDEWMIDYQRKLAEAPHVRAAVASAYAAGRAAAEAKAEDTTGGEWQYGYVHNGTGKFVVFDRDTTRAVMADPDGRQYLRRRWHRDVYGPVEAVTADTEATT